MESRRQLERAFALFAREGDMTGQLSAWSAIIECIFYGMDETASLDPWIAWLDEHVPPSFQYPSAEVEAIVTSSMAGALAQRQPHHPRVEYWMERAVAVLHSSADVQLRLRAGTFVAQHDVWRGELGRLARVANEIRLISRLPNASPLSLILWHWCESYAVASSIEGSVERSLQCLETGLALARKTGVHVFDTMLLAQGAVSSLAAGDVAGAQAYLRRIEAGPQGKNSRALQHYLAAWVNLDAQDARAAVIHAQESLRLAVDVGNWTGMALSRLALADALGAAGRMREAYLEVAQARAQADASGYMHLRSDCDLVEAHLLLTTGDPGARPAIEQAMATVRSRGFLSAYFGAPRYLARLCLEALVAGIEVDYVRLLVRVRRLRLDPPPLHCAAWPWDTRVATLGQFEIARDGTPVEFSGKAPRRTLLFLKTLIACGERGASGARIADLLWPDAEGDNAHQALTTSLHRLRRLLGNEKAVQLREGRIRLDGRYCWVDAHAFETLFAKADERKGVPSERLSAEQCRELERALALYKGPFLGEASEPWLASYRERLRRRFIRGVERVGASYEIEQRYDRAEQWYLQGIEADETAESLYRRLIRCQGLAGRTADAMATYERCRRALRSSLGVEPSPETDTLLAGLVQGPGDAVPPDASVH
jgi:LuxR family maltose regulon positive regulatory protein